MSLAIAFTALPEKVQGVVAPSCKDGGSCKLGDVGPNGGVVFYAASTPQWWGQYMEALKSYAENSEWL
ncbi:MAG: hypothetical protein EBX38_04725, partial [Actinobacteria bacterium]|nr:hypothetical protein [Actinomycetota bacterium]